MVGVSYIFTQNYAITEMAGPSSFLWAGVFLRATRVRRGVTHLRPICSPLGPSGTLVHMQTARPYSFLQPF